MSIFDRFRPYPELKVGIVNLKSGTAIRGVVWKVSGPYMVIRNAELLQDRGKDARLVMDGEAVVRLADVDFVQVLGSS